MKLVITYYNSGQILKFNTRYLNHNDAPPLTPQFIDRISELKPISPGTAL
jgi:hypothetical protein